MQKFPQFKSLRKHENKQFSPTGYLNPRTWENNLNNFFISTNVLNIHLMTLCIWHIQEYF